MVGSFGVREGEPPGEFAVEGCQVVEQQVLVVVHKRFLEGAVETLKMKRPMVVETVGRPNPGWHCCHPCMCSLIRWQFPLSPSFIPDILYRESRVPFQQSPHEWRGRGERHWILD